LRERRFNAWTESRDFLKRANCITHSPVRFPTSKRTGQRSLAGRCVGHAVLDIMHVNRIDRWIRPFSGLRIRVFLGWRCAPRVASSIRVGLPASESGRRT
jgi:hypothetical protein